MIFERLRYRYRNYRLSYFVECEKGIWKASFYDKEKRGKERLLVGETKNECIKMTKMWFRNLVDTGEVIQLRRRTDDVDVYFESILKTVRNESVGYHITQNQNVERILEEGILPNGNEYIGTRKASQVLDSIRPESIPSFVRREFCVYVRPEIDNEYLTDLDAYQDCALFAVDLDLTQCWVGSEGCGGFCLFGDDEIWTEEVEKQHLEYLLGEKGWANEYWKASCSLQEFIQKTKKYRLADQKWGLDEILVMHQIPTKKIHLIGRWDNRGVFYQNENFILFVKNKFRERYREILKKY